MTRIQIKLLRIVLAAVAGVTGLFVSVNVVPPTGSTSFVTPAYAIIGRPLTPMSYAGVARRSAVGVGVGVGVGVAVGVGAAAVVVAPVCAQVVNVYGQITTVCR
jgi:hypothetical protein